jgi:hypothetical protein
MGNRNSVVLPPIDPKLLYANTPSRLLINKNLTQNDINELSKQLSAPQCICADLFLHSTKLSLASFQTLLGTLLKNTTITTLDLSNTNFNDAAVPSLAKVLLYNNTLQVLFLNDNQITNNGLSQILKSLENNTSLHTLSVERNCISDPSLYQSARQIFSRPAIAYQRRDIDHTISIPVLSTGTPTIDNRNAGQSTTSTYLAKKDNQTFEKNHFHDSNDVHREQVIVVTATPTLTINSDGGTRDRKLSRSGSKSTIDDLKKFHDLNKQNGGNFNDPKPSPQIDSQISSRAPTGRVRSNSNANRLNNSTDCFGLYGITSNSPQFPSRSQDSNSKLYELHDGNSGKIISNQQLQNAFDTEDDEEALNYVHSSSSFGNLDTTSNSKSGTTTTSPRTGSKDKNTGSSRSKTQRGSSAHNSNNSIGQNNSDNKSNNDNHSNNGDADDNGDDGDDEEWFLNNDEYRRSTTFLGNLLGGYPKQINLDGDVDEGNEYETDWDAVEDDDLCYPSMRIIGDDDTKKKKSSRGKIFNARNIDIMQGSGHSSDESDDDTHGYEVNQYLHSDKRNKSRENHNGKTDTSQNAPELNLLGYLTLDLEYFGAVQINPETNIENIVRDSEKTQQKNKKVKAVHPNDIIFEEDDAELDDYPKKSIKKKSKEKEKNKTQKDEFNDAQKKPPKEQSKKSKTTQTNPESLSQSQVSLPPSIDGSAQPSLNSNSVFTQPTQDNNGTLTGLIEAFLAENNSEANALPNFGRMCKLYRRKSITLEKYGQVLLYFFNFSQLARIMPRLISSLYDHENPNKVSEWFSSHTQAPAMFSMTNYFDSLSDREMFQLSLCCSKVPHTLSPLDGEEYITYLQELTRKEIMGDQYKPLKTQGESMVEFFKTVSQWNQGLSYQLYLWWVNQGCEYTGLPLIQPISSNEENEIKQLVKVEFGEKIKGKELELDSVIVPIDLQSSQLQTNFREFAVAIDIAQSSEKKPETNQIQDETMQTPISKLSKINLDRSLDTSRFSLNRHGSLTGLNTNVTVESLVNSSILLPTINSSFSPGTTLGGIHIHIDNDQSDLYEFKSSSPLKTSMLSPRSSLKSLHRGDLTKLLNMSQAEKNDFGTRRNVKDSPFLNFDRNNRENGNNNNNNNNGAFTPTKKSTTTTISSSSSSSTIKPTPTYPFQPTTAAPPTSQPSTHTGPSANPTILPNKPMSKSQLQRITSYQVQLDTLDDGTTAHNLDNSRLTMNGRNQPDFDSLRSRLTLSRQQSLTVQLQTHNLLPIEHWVNLARQPNHLSAKSNEGITLDKLDQLLAAADTGTVGLRKEPRLSTLLFHLHLVFPNPISPSGRYSFIDQLPPQPTFEEIKQVYRKVSLVVHPDKLVNKHPQVRELGTEVFRLISSAFKRYSVRQQAGGAENAHTTTLSKKPGVGTTAADSMD